MVYSIIQKSQLEGALRLDAEYYQPEYLKLQKKLNKISSSRLNKVANINGGKRLPLGEDFSESGISYIRIVDIQNNFIDYENANFISEKLHDKLEKYQIRNKDILVTIVGNSVGLTGFNQGSLLKCNFTENCARIRAINLSPEFLFVVLISKIGQLQVSRERVGAAQPKLSLDRLRNFKIPLFPSNIQKFINKLVYLSKTELEESKKLYQKAENLLLEKLGLAGEIFEDELSYVVDFSDVKSANRIDANYFQPKYRQILKRLSLQKMKRLEEVFDLIKGKNLQYTKEGEIGVVKTKQLGKQFVNFEVESKTTTAIVKKQGLPILKDRDVLFASMGVGSLGKTNILYKFEVEDQKYTIDSTLRIFRSKEGNEVLPEILTVFLGSRIGQTLIYKYIVGTSGIISIYSDYLMKFPVLILSELIQQKIANLVRQSHEARKKSKQLLEKAKREVEEMIEKGGE